MLSVNPMLTPAQFATALRKLVAAFPTTGGSRHPDVPCADSHGAGRVLLHDHHLRRRHVGRCGRGACAATSKAVASPQRRCHRRTTERSPRRRRFLGAFTAVALLAAYGKCDPGGIATSGVTDQRGHSDRDHHRAGASRFVVRARQWPRSGHGRCGDSDDRGWPQRHASTLRRWRRLAVVAVAARARHRDDDASSAPRFVSYSAVRGVRCVEQLAPSAPLWPLRHVTRLFAGVRLQARC